MGMWRTAARIEGWCKGGATGAARLARGWRMRRRQRLCVLGMGARGGGQLNDWSVCAVGPRWQLKVLERGVDGEGGGCAVGSGQWAMSPGRVVERPTGGTTDALLTD